MFKVENGKVRKLFAKGFINTLTFVHERESVRHADIHKFLYPKVVGAKGSVSVIVKSLTAMGLLKREIEDTVPISAHYSITELGKQVAEHLQALRELLERRK